MAGEWASALGQAILGGQQGYQNARVLQMKQQQSDDEHKLQALQMALTQGQVDDLPRQRARQSFTDATTLYGSGAFDMPDVVQNAQTAGIPIQRGSGAGYAPNTGVRIPSSILASENSAALGGQKAQLELNQLLNKPSPEQEHQWEMEKVRAQHPDAMSSPKAEQFNQQLTSGIKHSIEQLAPQISMWTTGPIGTFLSHIGGTDAANFKANITSLKANIGFRMLNEMRQANRTGGALGQISDKENELLASVLANLDQAQSPSQFRSNLAYIQQVAEQWEQAKATNPNEVQQFLGGGAPQASATPPPQASPAGGLAVGGTVSYAEIVRRTQGTGIDPQQLAAQLKAAHVTVTK